MCSDRTPDRWSAPSPGARPAGLDPLGGGYPLGDLTVQVHHEGARAVVVPHGEIDLHTRRHLCRAIDAVLTSGRHVVVDMSQATFIDSSGLAVLADVHRQLAATEGDLTIRAPQRAVRKVLHLSGIDQVLTIEDDVPR